MRPWLGRLGRVAMATAVALAATAFAHAETFTLELKRLERPGKWPDGYPWALEKGLANCAMVWGGDVEQVDFWLAMWGQEPLRERPDFAEVVHREPGRYQAARPLRGVVKLGDGYFGFVLDTQQPGSTDYTRLYFDRNHNADLTDDGIIEGERVENEPPPAEDRPASWCIGTAIGNRTEDEPAAAEDRAPAPWFSSEYGASAVEEDSNESRPIASRHEPEHSWEFPRVDLTLEVDGHEIDYGFFSAAKPEPQPLLRLSDEAVLGSDQPGRGRSEEPVNQKEEPATVSAWILPGVCREAKVELGGKTHRVAAIDFDSDGRFDDRERADQRDSRFQWPDLLLVDPEPGEQGAMNAIWYLLADSCLRKLATIDGTFYVVDVSPGGDRLTLSPPPQGIGSLVSPADGFTATLDGDLGPLEISGDKAHPIALPAGQWKLREYSIDLSRQWAEANKGRTSDEPRIPNLSRILADAYEPQGSNDSGQSYEAGDIYLTQIEAQGDGKPLEVVQGRTIEFPFGPPYRLRLTPTDRSDRKTVELEISLIGIGGERCTSLTVDGQPADAWIDICTRDGHLVDSGKLDWAVKPFRTYEWQVPWNPADEYDLSVRLDPGPFEVDQSRHTVVRLSELGIEGLVRELRREVAELRAEIERLREEAQPPRTSDARRP